MRSLLNLTHWSALALVAVVVTAVLMMTAPLAASEDTGEVTSNTDWWTIDTKIEKLGLSESQVNLIGEIETRFAPLISDSRRARVRAYRQVVRLLDSTGYSPDDLDSKTKAFQDAFTQEVQVKVNHWVELRSVLDDDQWKNLPSVAPQDMVVAGFGVSARGKVFVGGPGVPQAKGGAIKK